MADIDIGTPQVAARRIELDDHLVGFDPSPRVTATNRSKRDSLREVWRRLLAAFPSDLTNDERESAREALGIVDRIPEHSQTNREFLAGSRNVLSFEPVNEVPDTPGTSTGVGHVLTVTGENDADYAWRAPTGGGGDTSGLDARITTNAGNISELQTEVQTASRSIADNEGRLTTAETDINNLEAEDSTLAASIAGNTTAIQTNTGNIGTNSNLISATTRTLQSLVSEVDTLHPKIGRLVPITPWIRNNEARTIRFAWFPLAAVSTSDTLRMSIGGIAHTPRVTEGYLATDVSGIVLAVPVSAANSATITRESNTTSGFVRVDLVMDRAQFHCYIPAEDPPSSGGSSAWRAVDTSFDWQHVTSRGFKAVNLDAGDTEIMLIYRWTAPDNSYFLEQTQTTLLARIPSGTTTFNTLGPEVLEDNSSGDITVIGAGIRRTTTANRFEISAWRGGLGPSAADNWQIKAVYAR